MFFLFDAFLLKDLHLQKNHTTVIWTKQKNNAGMMFAVMNRLLKQVSALCNLSFMP